MQYNTIIVDDESHALATLQRYIEKLPTLQLIGVFENPLEALQVLTGNEPPQIAFLDIDMPELNGLALAELAANKVEIIFTSAHDQYAMDAHGLQVAGYLLKPFSFESFVKTVQKICDRISPDEKESRSRPLFFSASLKGRYVKIISEDILYIEAMLNYVKIFSSSDDNPKVIYLSLKDAEAKLGEKHFIRVSRSFVVNAVHIEIVEGNLITMSDGKKINVGPNYRTPFHCYLRANSLGGTNGQNRALPK